MAHLLGWDMEDESMIFQPLQESFHPKRHVNIGFANAMLVLNKAFEDLSINIIDEPKCQL